MWINALESGTGAGGPDNVVHGLPCERQLTLGDEEPRQCIVPAREPALDSPQLVASDWLLCLTSAPMGQFEYIADRRVSGSS